MAVFYFATAAAGAQLTFNLMEDFLSFDSIAGADAGFIRLAQVDADLRVSMVGGPFDGKSVFLLDVAAADVDINKFSELSGFVWVGDNNNEGVVDDDGTNIFGTNNGDFIMGLGGNDTVSALGGNDVIDMSVGAAGYGIDSIDGGSGADLVLFGATMSSGVTVNLGTQTVTGGVAGSRAKLISIEHVSGTQFGDSITGNGVANNLAGEGGNDTLNGAGGNDNLGGGAGNDKLNGGAGNDMLNGGTGSDTQAGADGNDVIVWTAGDSVNGGTGTDSLRLAVALDLTALPNSRITNIETIDMRGGGNDTLTLTTVDVLALSSETDTIRILGNAGDIVNIDRPTLPTPTLQGIFERYALGNGAVLLIDADMTVV